jgi:hypothetical protein
MFRFIKKLKNLGLSESGAATVEFVIVFPFFVGIFLSSFEVAMMNMRAVMMERAMDLSVREIRLSSGAELDYDEILETVCDRARIIPDCLTNVRMQLQAVDKSDFAGIGNTPDCVKRDEDIQPAVEFKNGVENELMLIRICAVIDPFFPNLGVGRSMPVDSTGGYQIIASSAFVNEPQ